MTDIGTTDQSMIGGMVSSTILTLVVIPVVYALWRGRSIHSEDWNPE